MNPISCCYRTPKIADVKEFVDVAPSSLISHHVQSLESENNKMIDLAKDFFPENPSFLNHIIQIINFEGFLECPEKVILKYMLEVPLREFADCKLFDVRDLARVFVAMKTPSFKQEMLDFESLEEMLEVPLAIKDYRSLQAIISQLESALESKDEQALVFYENDLRKLLHSMKNSPLNGWGLLGEIRGNVRDSCPEKVLACVSKIINIPGFFECPIKILLQEMLKKEELAIENNVNCSCCCGRLGDLFIYDKEDLARVLLAINIPGFLSFIKDKEAIIEFFCERYICLNKNKQLLLKEEIGRVFENLDVKNVSENALRLFSEEHIGSGLQAEKNLRMILRSFLLAEERLL